MNSRDKTARILRVSTYKSYKYNCQLHETPSDFETSSAALGESGSGREGGVGARTWPHENMATQPALRSCGMRCKRGSTEGKTQ